MFDARWKRTQRELWLAAFGVSVETFDPWVLDRFTQLVEDREFRAGQVLWSRGSVVESLFFMRQGRVQARRPGAPPWTFEGRWFLGGFEGHIERPASRDLVALTDFYALEISRRGFMELLEDSLELTRQSLASMASAVAGLDERVSSLVRPEAPPRLAPVSEEPLSMVERLAFMTELRVTRLAGVQAFADLAAAAEEIRLGPKESLFPKGAAVDQLFLVVEGEVEARRDGPVVERHYVAGDAVLGAQVLAGLAGDWAAEAVAPARILAIRFDAWFDAVEEHFELAQAAFAVLASQRDLLLERIAADAGPEELVLT